MAHAEAIKEADVLNAETINTKYLSPLRSIFRYHQGVGLKRKLPTNPFDGVAARKKRTAKRDSKRREFTSREVRTMLSQPMFTGAKGTTYAPLYQRGDVRISDWRYWVPLLSLFTGARLNEVCANHLHDYLLFCIGNRLASSFFYRGLGGMRAGGPVIVQTCLICHLGWQARHAREN